MRQTTNGRVGTRVPAKLGNNLRLTDTSVGQQQSTKDTRDKASKAGQCAQVQVTAL